MLKVLSPIGALLVSIALMMAGHGLQSTVVPLAAQTLEFTRLEIGAAASAYFIGMICGFLLCPYAILRAGHIRAAAAIISTGSAAALLHPFIIDPIAWMGFRVVTGFCVAGFYLVFESWLNEHATNETRGLVMSIYIIVSYNALVLGQVAASIDPSNYLLLFAVASIIISLSIVPVTLTRAAQPAPITIVRFRPGWLYKTSPAAVVCGFFLGALLGTEWMMAPVYATEMGFSSREAPFFAGAIIMGGVFAQWPIGRLSDRVDRRYVLLVISIAGAAIALFIANFTTDNINVLMALGFALGAATQPAYSLALSHGYDHADAENYVEMAAGLLVVFSVGSAIGPIAASLMMEQMGPQALFQFVALMCIVTASYLALRIGIRSAPQEADKEDYSFATSAAVVGGVMTPEAPDESDDLFAMPQPFWAEDEEDTDDEASSTSDIIWSEGDGDIPEADNDNRDG